VRNEDGAENERDGGAYLVCVELVCYGGRYLGSEGYTEERQDV
jgi:hypothetical protein